MTPTTVDLLNLGYDYNQPVGSATVNNGQIQAMHFCTTDPATCNEDLSKSENFTYDAWSRLGPAGTGNGTSWGLQWQYDRFGNRLQQNVTAGSAPGPSVSVDPATNRINSSGYAYDAAGNMIWDAIHDYAYDAENRLTVVDPQLNPVAATYTHLGALRVKKVAGGTSTVYVYSGTKPIAEYATDATGTKLTEHIYGGSGMLATLNPDGTTTYHHPDHLSIRAESDASGNLIRSTGHFPFGEAWYDTGSGSKWQFTTYERDSESGLDYADYRFYSSRLGRFMQQDPLGGELDNPESLDLYTYVLNDPSNLTDAAGMDPFLGCLLNDVGDCTPGTVFTFNFGGNAGNINACTGSGLFGDPGLGDYFCAGTHGGTQEFLTAIEKNGFKNPFKDPIADMYGKYLDGLPTLVRIDWWTEVNRWGEPVTKWKISPILFDAFMGPIITRGKLTVPKRHPGTGPR